MTIGRRADNVYIRILNVVRLVPEVVEDNDQYHGYYSQEKDEAQR